MSEAGRTRARQAAALLLLGGVFAGALVIASAARLEPAELVFNNATEVSTLDPATVTGVPEGRILRALFEGLTVQDPHTLAPLPGSAESWQVSDDGLVYTFQIRQGAVWTNGDPVTAHDFTFSFERILNPLTAAEYAYQLWYVAGARAYTSDVAADGGSKHAFDTVGIRALSDHELEITLDSPTPFFIDLMGFYPLFPVNRRNIEEAKERWPDAWRLEWLKPENIVTNGPYQVAYRRVNDRIRLVKNESYWDADNVAFTTIDALAIQQATTYLNVYLTGGCSYITSVPVNVIPRLLQREDFNPTPYLGSYFYRVNVTRPPFDDARVRKALSLTIDRKAIVEKITKAGQLPAYGVVPPGMHGYTNAETEREDNELAKKLLGEAGYGPGKKPFPTLEIHYNTLESHRDIAEVIANSWQRNLGISAKLLNQEWKVYLETQSNLQYDVSRGSWIGDYGDPNTFLDMFVTGGQNNKTGWGDPEYDKLIAAAAQELAPPRRMQILQEAEAILMRDLPVLPIYYYTTQNMVSPRLGGWHENIQDVHFPKFWYWMDDEELAQKRAKLPADVEIVDPGGPGEGLYSPNEMARRRAQ